MMNNLINRQHSRRLKLFWIIFTIGIAVIVGKAVQLQLLDGRYNSQFWHQQSQKLAVRTYTVPFFRGTIYDKQGDILAVSAPMASVRVMPQALLASPHKQQILSKALSWSTDQLVHRLQKHADQNWHTIPTERHQAVADLNLDEVQIVPEIKRLYPAKEITAHLLGFTGHNHRGQEGVELSYDGWLHGQNGHRTVLVGSKNGVERQIIRELEPTHNHKKGKDLHLSVDLRIQATAYEELKRHVVAVGAKNGSIVVADTYSGEILAMVSYPSFDPNDLSQRNPQNGTMRNRAALDLFEPGSTIKPFMMAVGLASGAFTPYSTIDTAPGRIIIEGKLLRDPRNYGQLTVSDVLARSSQVGTARLSLMMQPYQLVHLIRSVGFGQLTGVSFPGETIGSMPWRDKWNDLDTVTFAYGYGFSGNSLQLVRSYIPFARRGKLPTLTLLSRDPTTDADEYTVEVMNPKVADSVLTMLERATLDDGTARRAHIAGYRVAGKTGTVHKTNEEGYASDRYIALFVGIVPLNDPRFVAVVKIDEPHGDRYFGGQVAAPVFSRVMAMVLHLMNIPQDRPFHKTSSQKDTLLSDTQYAY